MLGEEAIGFSIPIIDIYPLLQGWVQQPLTKQEVINLFYNDNGNYYYEDLWENEEEWYFDDGEYQEEDTDTYNISLMNGLTNHMKRECMRTHFKKNICRNRDENVTLGPIPKSMRTMKK